MLPVLSREQMQAFDQFASTSWHVPSLLLMENAGRGAADIIAGRLKSKSSVVVVTGLGNNAGDGFVVARRLLVLGHDVAVMALCPPAQLTSDARVNAEALVAMGGSVTNLMPDAGMSALEVLVTGAECIVDAIFGTGLTREVEGLFRDAIQIINRTRGLARRPQIVALDLPSGLECSRGRTMGEVVQADLTITFAHYKLGQLTPNGVDCCGEIQRVDIGVPSLVPANVGQSAALVESEDIRQLLHARPLSAHKNSVGRVIVFAGSPGKVGAALLVGQAALRTGAGVVTLAGFEEVAALFDRRVQELMTARIDPAQLTASVAELCNRADAVVMGPGLGLDQEARLVVQAVLDSFSGPIVMDADALTHFAGDLAALATANGSLLLTPHPGEMARLLGVSSDEVEDDRLQAAKQASQLAGATVLLKGPCTIVAAPDQLPVIHRAQAPALATAGSGDVLAGILAALCTALPTHSAALVGAFLHARAAEAWQTTNAGADRGLLAREVIDWVPRIIAGLTQEPATLPV